MKNNLKYSLNIFLMCCLALFIVLVLLLLSPPQVNNAYANEDTTDAKIYSTATIEQDFDPCSILVTLDRKTSGINRLHNTIIGS